MIQHNQKGMAMRSYSQLQYKKYQGFSLIELMVVVAIIGIIAAIALPGYTDYIRRGKVAEATSTLADYKIRMEQYYQDNRTYENVGTLIAPCAPPVGTTKYFTIACTVQTANTFTLTATPNSNADLSGFLFTINESNVKTSTYKGVTGATCWLNSASGSCS